MKFGIRVPSLRKRIAARTSVKRIIRHNVGLKMPRGLGILTNPKKALYNRIYNRTSISVEDAVRKSGCVGMFLLLFLGSSVMVKFFLLH